MGNKEGKDNKEIKETTAKVSTEPKVRNTAKENNQSKAKKMDKGSDEVIGQENTEEKKNKEKKEIRGLRYLRRIRRAKQSDGPTLRERFNYRFDNIMTKGMVAKVGLLLGFTLICIIIFGIIIFLVFRQMGIRGSVWQSFLHVIDPGTIAGDQGGFLYTLIMFILTIFGLLFTGTLIGILNNGMEQRMESLAKGKSHVLEKGHTVVLGYNDVTLSILDELMEANSNHKRIPVVVMDQVRAVDMEYDVRNRLGSDRHTKFIFRTGVIYNYNDLDICSLQDCKSVIINATEDFDTVKAILACKGKLDELEERKVLTRDVYITAVIRHEEFEQEARLAGGWRLKLIVYPRIMAKIIAGAGRQPGLSYVYTELFNYDGNEVYCDYIKPRYGLTEDVNIYDINQYMEDTIIIGGIPHTYRTSSRDIRELEYETDQSEKVYTFPAFPPSMQFKAFDKFLILEEDDEDIKILPPDMASHRIRTEHIRKTTMEDTSPVKIVILGISPMLKQILYELNGYYAGMNKVVKVVLADNAPIEPVVYELKPYIEYPALQMRCKGEVDVYSYEELERILDASVTSIMLLTEDMENPVKEDESVLMQLLYLREIRRRHGYDFNITCEMNLDSNRELAELTGHSDFVVGSNVTALIMTQISEYHELYDFFEEILSNNGSEIYMRKAMAYLNFTEDVLRTDFYTMTKAAAMHGEVLIGLQKLKADPGEGRRLEYEEPVLNPPKWTVGSDGKKQLLEYALKPEDLLVVISSH